MRWRVDEALGDLGGYSPSLAALHKQRRCLLATANSDTCTLQQCRIFIHANITIEHKGSASSSRHSRVCRKSQRTGATTRSGCGRLVQQRLSLQLSRRHRTHVRALHNHTRTVAHQRPALPARLHLSRLQPPRQLAQGLDRAQRILHLIARPRRPPRKPLRYCETHSRSHSSSATYSSIQVATQLHTSPCSCSRSDSSSSPSPTRRAWANSSPQ